MKTGAKIFMGLLLAAAGIGAVVWLARSSGVKPKNPYSPSTEYYVDPQYKLPAGVTQIDTSTIPTEMVDAVLWKHTKFVLHEAYVDDAQSYYLVETHEGFDPLVFKVVPKEVSA